MRVKEYKRVPVWHRDVDIYFAFIPRKDINGDWFWLERYYYMEELHFGGAICFRGRKRNFKSKEDFWHKVRGRGWI